MRNGWFWIVFRVFLATLVTMFVVGCVGLIVMDRVEGSTVVDDPPSVAEEVFLYYAGDMDGDEPMETWTAEPDMLDQEPAEQEVPVEPEPILETPASHRYYKVVERYGEVLCPVEYQDMLWSELETVGHTEWYEVLLCIMYCESNFSPNVVSYGSYGLMQINKASFSTITASTGVTDWLDPASNIKAGVWEFGYHYGRYGDVERAIVAYQYGNARNRTSSAYSRKVLGMIGTKLVEM